MRLFGLLLIVLFSKAGLTSTALLDFSNSMYSFSADFTQTVYDSDSVVLQENKGQVKLMRPGKFRWTYNEPFKQVIVADGLTLWVYDEDIAQVTMRPQADTLGSAPIGLLSGQRAIQSEFDIISLGPRDDLQWFKLEPRVKDTDFQQVFIALDGNGLRAMELRDSFEQATQIRFTNFRKNVEIATDEFKFSPPAGVDVVGEAGVAAEETATVAAPVQQFDTDPLLAPEATPINTDVMETQEDTAAASQTDEVLSAPAPVAPEDVLKNSTDALLLETPDDAPGIAEAETGDAPADSEVTFEVIEKTEIPAE